ncbi:FAD-dependent monooxygenase [Psychromicrobium sp. YIM B11713]|uniref:FAD-dependent monooxygenase n=1 Tax=Psychromicrobium sp. YIM B11713 TaxID=3145233 RepID=UPI00374FC376
MTIVERASHLRVTGTPIDVRGDAIEIARQMGILPRLIEERVRMTELVQLVDGQGRVLADLVPEQISDSPDDLEIARKDLSQILTDALPESVQLTFAESISALHDTGDVVEVTFTSAGQDVHDLVVGADGLHSAVRRPVFGPEENYLKYLGVYFGITTLPSVPDDGRRSMMYNFPNHPVGYLTYRTGALGFFVFRSEPLHYDHQDIEAQRRLLREAFSAEGSWKLPDLLDNAQHDEDFYLDSASQIHLPSWSSGRVVLIGDAAHSAAFISGRGISLALTGTWFLAQALEQHPNDLKAAFAAYAEQQRPLC